MRLLVTDAAAQPPRQATAWLIMTFGKMKKIKQVAWWLALLTLVGTYGFTLTIDFTLREKIVDDATALYLTTAEKDGRLPDLKNHMINCSMAGLSRLPAAALILYLSSTLGYVYYKRK